MNPEPLARLQALEYQSRLLLTSALGSPFNRGAEDPHVAANDWRNFSSNLLHPGGRLDFEGVDLYGYLFVGPTIKEEPFRNANFRHSILIRTRWLGSEIKEADFGGADLSGCEMKLVRASGALFRDANLTDAFLDFLVLDSDLPIDFTNATLRHTVFSLSDPCRFIFTGAVFDNCSLVVNNEKEDRAHAGTVRRSLIESLSADQKQGFEMPRVGSVASGRCFIGGAAFADPASPEVEELRVFRDSYLKTSGMGRRFVTIYERISPAIARFIARSPAACAVARALLSPLVAVAKALNDQIKTG